MATSLLELCAWYWFVRRVCVCGSGWLRQEAQKYPDRVSAVLAKCQDERLLNVCQPYWWFSLCPGCNEISWRDYQEQKSGASNFFPKGFLSISVSEKSGKNTWTEMMMYLSITAPWCHPPCEIQAVSTALSTVGVIFYYCSSYSCCSAGDVTLNTGTLLETMDLPAWLSVGEGSQLALPISAADGSETWPFVSWGAEAALHEVPPLSPSLS